MPLSHSLLSMVGHYFLLLQTALGIVALCPRSARTKATWPARPPTSAKAISSRAVLAMFAESYRACQEQGMFVYRRYAKINIGFELWPESFRLAIKKCFCAIRS